MGEPNGALLDAAERLMRSKKGYGYGTSRKVADGAGLEPQLVHYYFRIGGRTLPGDLPGAAP